MGKGFKKENRTLFLQFCEQSCLKVMNTFFRKPPVGYCTFRENTTMHGAEWTPTRYAQLDFWLVGEKWIKSCKDVVARPDIYFPSDHYVLEATIKVKLPGFEETPNKRIKFRQPTEEEWNRYNLKLKELWGDVMSLQNYDWKALSNQILLAANASLTKENPQQRRNYISRRTWNLIQKRQNEHQNGNSQAVEQLNNEIRRGARKDRKDALLNSLRELPDAREKWQGVKELKRDPAPKFIRLRNLQGQLVAPKDRAETIAEYLSLKHWRNPVHQILQRDTPLYTLQDAFNTDEFNMAEYNAASNPQISPC